MDFNSVTTGSKYERAYHEFFRFLAQPIRFLIPTIIDRLPFFDNEKYKECTAVMKKMTCDVIEQKREQQKNPSETRQPDLLDMMMKTHLPITDSELQCNVFVFFIAGHETTATALITAIDTLARYPEIQQKARDEVDQFIGKDVPNADNVKNLQYLDMFIKEVLRHYSLVTSILPRISQEDLYVDDVLIPKGSNVTISIRSAHMNPEFWPDPTKFDPLRFSPENSVDRHPYSFIPFSIGKRQCIGNTISLLEQKVFLSMLLQKYTVGFVEELQCRSTVILTTPLKLRVSLKQR